MAYYVKTDAGIIRDTLTAMKRALRSGKKGLRKRARTRSESLSKALKKLRRTKSAPADVCKRTLTEHERSDTFWTRDALDGDWKEHSVKNIHTKLRNEKEDAEKAKQEARLEKEASDMVDDIFDVDEALLAEDDDSSIEMIVPEKQSVYVLYPPSKEVNIEAPDNKATQSKKTAPDKAKDVCKGVVRSRLSFWKELEQKSKEAQTDAKAKPEAKGPIKVI